MPRNTDPNAAAIPELCIPEPILWRLSLPALAEVLRAADATGNPFAAVQARVAINCQTMPGYIRWPWAEPPGDVLVETVKPRKPRRRRPKLPVDAADDESPC